MWNRKVKAKTVEKYIQFWNLCFDGILKQVLFCMRISGASCFLLYWVGSLFIFCRFSLRLWTLDRTMWYLWLFWHIHELKNFLSKRKTCPRNGAKNAGGIKCGQKMGTTKQTRTNWEIRFDEVKNGIPGSNQSWIWVVRINATHQNMLYFWLLLLPFWCVDKRFGSLAD